jgi:hypothetical protein
MFKIIIECFKIILCLGTFFSLTKFFNILSYSIGSGLHYCGKGISKYSFSIFNQRFYSYYYFIFFNNFLICSYIYIIHFSTSLNQSFLIHFFYNLSPLIYFYKLIFFIFFLNPSTYIYIIHLSLFLV